MTDPSNSMPDESVNQRSSVSPRRKSLPLKTTALMAGLGLGNLAAWLWAWSAFADRPALLGLALLAWTFGLRHAIDADHIAAIDNVVRKLMQEGQRPIGVGFFFSLGHSTIVVLATAAIAWSAAGAQAHFAFLEKIGAVAGTAISALFLFVIALVNFKILRAVWDQFRRVSAGEKLDEAGFEAMMNGRGLLARVLRPAIKLVRRSLHMYPLGFVFGLGFDTATEVGLLGIAGIQAAQGLSPWQILVFPALFTAGMTLIDSADAIMMVGAYEWAFVHPVRKLWYNLTMTAASVAAALLIGGLEALGLIVNQAGLHGGIWRAVAGLNDNLTGFGLAVIAIFALSWIASVVLYRRGGFEKKIAIEG